MKRIFTSTIFVMLLSNVFSQRSDCSVYPYPNTSIQKDGSSITLVGYGTESEHYVETTEGFTVLLNSNGIYEFAKYDEKGNLVPSGVKAGSGLKALGKSTVEKHLRYSKQQRAILAETFAQLSEISAKKSLGKAGPQGFPTKGNHKVCVLLIQYPDLLASVSRSVFENLFNQVNYNNTGSFRDYYQKASYGQLNLSIDVFGWFTSVNGYKTYASSSRSLAVRAVTQADSAGVDFSQYDNDNNGEVDGVMILHSGIGAEEVSAPNSSDYIWSYRSSLGNQAVNTNDTVKVNSYCMFPEKRYSGGLYPTVGIGVMSHEFGHLLDAPDLYSVAGNGEGAGNFSNMAGGPWLNSEKTPCMHDAFIKIILEWHTPTLISQNGTYTIKKCAADSNFSYKIATTKVNEYFLLENKQPRGFDKFVPGRGLAIWHINTNTAGLLSAKGNAANNDTSKYGVGLVQADAQRHLEREINRGDVGDLYPGSSNNRSFTSASIPSSNFYPASGGGIRLPSNVSISNITINPDSSITFTFGSIASADFSVPSISGCVPYKVTFNNTSVFANNYRWNFGNGNTSTQQNPSYTFTQAGSYAVVLYVLDSVGKVLDSTTKTILVSESPSATYLVSRGDSNTFTFNTTSTNTDYVTWKFGASQSSSAQNPTVTFTGTGSLAFKLIAYKSICTDTAVGSIDLWALAVNNLDENCINDAVVYPNPFEENTSIKFNLSKQADIKISLINILGEKIWDQNYLNLTSGINQITLTTERMKAGIYFAEISINNSIVKTIKLVKSF